VRNWHAFDLVLLRGLSGAVSVYTEAMMFLVTLPEGRSAEAFARRW
jgi:hypothetical protein